MSDPIAPVNNTGAVKIVAAPSEPVKIASLPPDIPLDTTLQGQVIAKGNGQTTIQTPQGNVVLQGDIALQIGQKVQIALQRTDNQMTQLLLSVVSPAPDKSVQPSAQTLVTVQGNTATAAQLATPEQYPEQVAPQVTALPQKLSQPALQVLLQDILQQPADRALPPSLQQGLQNLQQLSSVLLPSMTAVAPSDGEAALVEQILQQLPTLLRTSAPTTQTTPTTINTINTPLQILQLLPPGQIVTPELLVAIRQALQPQQNTAPAATPQQVPQQPQQVQTPPILALVLGPAYSGPAIQQPTLLLLQNNGQQALGLLPLPTNSADKPQLFVPGTVLVLQPQAPASTTTPTAWPSFSGVTQPAMLAPSPLHHTLGDTWPALDAMWQGLQTDKDIPAAAQALHFMHAVLPQPNAQQFPAAILLFFAAIKSGKAEHWLPPATLDALADPVQKTILQQLATDITRMKTVLDDAPADRWQALPLPLQVYDQLHRLQLHFKPVFFDDEKQTSQEQGKRKNRNTRFVLDVPQTRLGDVQIDGMMRPVQLDMIVRTEQSLPSIAETEMRLRFFRVLEINGLSGELNFQSGRQSWVRV